jgi:hypothetical protein
MTVDQLVAAGNTCREHNNPEMALDYYAQAFAKDRKFGSAFNNYGNVLREIGEPAGAVPFLQRAIQLSSNDATPQFNLAVAWLLQGDYARGWPQYEHRWNFEHMAGTLPKYTQPRWTGQDLRGKTIFVLGEQGLGDNIQFVRFVVNLHAQGAKVILSADPALIPLFSYGRFLSQVIAVGQTPEHFDHWIPIMSLPGVLDIALNTLPKNLSYISADVNKIAAWKQILGLKNKLRIGFCYSGRGDTWVNRHKSMTVDQMCSLIYKNTNCDWINLQLDASAEDLDKLSQAGCKIYNEHIKDFSDTAALVHHLDLIISVDTAVAHLGGAMGRPTWIPLNWFGTDWRWLLDRDSSPWYSSVRLFRQPAIGDWLSVVDKLDQYIKWFKV